MNCGNSEINPTSLIDLQAELHKKYESFRNAKLRESSEEPNRTLLKCKTDQPKEKKTKHAPIVKKKEVNNEEEKALEKSRLALEAKAKLYEKIVSNKLLLDDEKNDNYLVDFQRKVLNENAEPHTPHQDNTNSASDSAEDQPSISSQNSERLGVNVPPPSSYQCNTKSQGHIPDPDQPIHYENVRFNEIRDHGTAYFAFSTDEAKRKEQMEELNALRQKTEEQRLSKQKLLKKRKEMLHSRLEKICERKNIDKSVLDKYKNTSEETEGPLPQETTDLSSIPLPEEAAKDPPKPKKVRPWDIGKEGVPFIPKKHKTKSQQEWVEEKREERPSEFAPPTSFMYNRKQ